MKSFMRKSFIALFGVIIVFQTILPYFEVAIVAEKHLSYIGKIIEEKETVITPGVNEKRMHVSNNRGHQRFSMLSVDLKDSNLSIVSGVPNGAYPGLQTLTGQAEHVSMPGHVVVGGINADFFDTSTGDVTGLFIRDGEVLNVGSRPAFGITSGGQAIIGDQQIIHQVIIDDKALTLSGTNMNREVNELIMYTPKYGESTATDPDGAEVTIVNLDGDIDKFGTVTGTVKEVNNGKGNTLLEKDTIVLSGDGTAKKHLIENFEIGDEVKISLGFNEPWNDVVEAVGGNLILVESGILAKLSESDFNNAIAPRTAVGIKGDGSIFFLVIDGRTPGYSEGVNIHELAEIMLDMGAVQAINLDGGGSSTLVSRQPGDGFVSVVNTPSDNPDGSERDIANALFIVSSAPIGKLSSLAISPSSELVLANSNITFEARGLDSAHNPVAVEDSIIWSLSDSLGEISSDGVFTAGGLAGSVELTASVGAVNGYANIEVVDEIDDIQLPQSELTLDRGGEFNLAARISKNGKKVVANQDLFTWDIEGDIGTINKDGVFTATDKTAKGTVTVSYGDVEDTITIEVGKLPIILADFEDGIDDWTYSGASYQSISIRQTIYPEPARFGKHALQINYDFTGMPGTSGVYAHTEENIVIEGYPEAIGMWVYGDGNGHWLRSQLRDGDNNAFAIDFVREVDWIGWKYIEAPVPGGKTTPLKLDLAFRYMEISSDNKNAGTIYVDNIRAVYGEKSDDLIQPTLSELKPGNDEVVTNNDVEITAIAMDDLEGTGINPDRIEMKVDGMTVIPIFNEKTGKISFRADHPFADGIHSVHLIVQDNFGNLIEQYWSFEVDTEDSEGEGPDEGTGPDKNEGPDEGTGPDKNEDLDEGTGSDKNEGPDDGADPDKGDGPSEGSILEKGGNIVEEAEQKAEEYLPKTATHIYNLLLIGLFLLLIGSLVVLRLRKV